MAAERYGANIAFIEELYEKYRNDPNAVSSGGGNWGLFQINTVHRDEFESVTGHPWSDVLDPYLNSNYAKWLYDQSGWQPWACRWAA